MPDLYDVAAIGNAIVDVIAPATDAWLAETEPKPGSWWPEWASWLAAQGGGQVVAPAPGAPDKGLAPLCPAPGSYVMQP